MQTTNLNVTYGDSVYAGFDFDGLPLGAARMSAAFQIDQVADQARRSVLGDSLRALEYQLTAQEARAFMAANYERAVPPTVQAWMDAVGKDAKSATADILAEASDWEGALHKIRAARLKGKHEVLQASSHAEAEVIADEAIAAIRAGIQGVGNAA
ncbi:hypothetical protein D3C77_132790 [compost metagenome]|uniref:hypothetical protein n=1 Tax=Pseudomonas vranovensis TaxID=321661 RepID=UPI0004245046|nr:hypothetical protein [Pseudomonas vranovensis]